MYFLLLLLLSPKINKLRWQCERQLLTVNNYSRKNNSDGIFIVMCLRPLYSMLFRICMGCYCCRCRCSRWRNWPSVISKGTRAHCTLMNHDTSLVMCARDRLVICFINLHCNKHSCRLHWFGKAQSIRSIHQWYYFIFSDSHFKRVTWIIFPPFRQRKNLLFFLSLSTPHLRVITTQKLFSAWNQSVICMQLFFIESVWFRLIHIYECAYLAINTNFTTSNALFPLNLYCYFCWAFVYAILCYIKQKQTPGITEQAEQETHTHSHIKW